MEGVPKFQKVGHVTLHDPFCPNFAILLLRTAVVEFKQPHGCDTQQDGDKAR